MDVRMGALLLATQAGAALGTLTYFQIYTNQIIDPGQRPTMTLFELDLKLIELTGLCPEQKLGKSTQTRTLMLKKLTTHSRYVVTLLTPKEQNRII